MDYLRCNYFICSFCFIYFLNIDFQHNNYVLKNVVCWIPVCPHTSVKSPRLLYKPSCCAPLRLYHESSLAIMPLFTGFVVQVGRCGSFKSVLHSCNHSNLKYRLKKEEKNKKLHRSKTVGQNTKTIGSKTKACRAQRNCKTTG